MQSLDVEGGKPAKKKLKSYSTGSFHIDIAEVQTAGGKLYLFVAIGRTSKFAFARLVEKANRVTAPAFLAALIKAVRNKRTKQLDCIARCLAPSYESLPSCNPAPAQ